MSHLLSFMYWDAWSRSFWASVVEASAPAAGASAALPAVPDARAAAASVAVWASAAASRAARPVESAAPCAALPAELPAFDAVPLMPDDDPVPVYDDGVDRLAVGALEPPDIDADPEPDRVVVVVSLFLQPWPASNISAATATRQFRFFRMGTSIEL